MKSIPLKIILKPWLIWLLAASFYMFESFLQISHSVISNDLATYFSLDATHIGLLATYFLFIYSIMQIPVGLILDRFGVKHPLVIAIFICSMGSCLFAYSHTFFVAALARILMGASAAFAAISCLEIAGLWFKSTQFSFLTGLLLSFGMIGQISAEAPLSVAIKHMSWQNVYKVFTIIGFILCVLVALCIDNKKKPSVISGLSLTQICSDIKQRLKDVMISGQTWLLALMAMFIYTPFLILINTWGIAFLALKLSINLTDSALLFSATQIGFAIGAPLLGAWSDWSQQRKPIFCLTIIGCFILSLCIIYVPSYYSKDWFRGFLFAFGFLTSGFLPSYTSAKELHPPENRATTVGFINTLNQAGGAILLPMIGFLLTKLGHNPSHAGIAHFTLLEYQHVLLVIPCLFVISFIILYYIKEDVG